MLVVLLKSLSEQFYGCPSCQNPSAYLSSIRYRTTECNEEPKTRLKNMAFKESETRCRRKKKMYNDMCNIPFYQRCKEPLQVWQNFH